MRRLYYKDAIIEPWHCHKSRHVDQWNSCDPAAGFSLLILQRPALLPVAVAKVEWAAYATYCCHPMAYEGGDGWVQLSSRFHRPGSPCALTNRVSSSKLPRSGAGPALPHAVAGEGQVQFSHSCDPRASSLACLRWQGVRRRGTFFSSPMPPLGRWGGQGQLFCSPVLWASSPVPTNRNRSTVLPQ